MPSRNSDSLGIEAIDMLMGISSGSGGATTMHSLILFDENKTRGKFSNAIQRCFTAEGIEQNQHIFLAGPLPHKMLNLLRNLPGRNDRFGSEIKNYDNEIGGKQDHNFKIAWRYQTNPTLTNPAANGTSQTIEKFDLSKTNEFDFLKLRDKVTVFNENKLHKQPSLCELWKELYQILSRPQFCAERKIDFLRILLSDLSSPIWNDQEYLPLFLAHLKAFCRRTNTIALLSLDSQLLQSTIYQNCVQYADVIFQLQTMNEKEQKALHLRQRIDGGRFFIHKLPMVASASPVIIFLSTDMLFSLKKCSFELSLLHLPPALSESKEEKHEKKKISCAIVDHF